MISPARSRARELRSRLLVTLLAAAGMAHGESLSGQDLVAALRTGGYVIVMRHASSPNAPPAAAQADTGNVRLERQLDAAGRASAHAMGDALRRLHIRVDGVLSSPTYRALETVRLAQLGSTKTYSQLGDAGRNMKSDSSGKRAAWLRQKVSQSPHWGTNTIIVTHLPNLIEAFGNDAAALADGEALIFHPNGRAKVTVVGRIRIDDWPRLAAMP